MSDRADEAPRIVNDAGALMIGAELLSGKIRDENLYALSNTLRALGIDLKRVVFCPDDKDTIAREVATMKDDFDVVFTSGGVGPTHDDVTVDGIAQALGVETVVSEYFEKLLRGIYGVKTTETHLRMARVPAGAQLSDGAGVRWPTIVADNVWILPGVPELFKMKLAVIRSQMRGPQPFFTRELFVNVEETEIKEVLDEVVAAHPEVEVGSYPKWFDSRYKTRITFDSRSEELGKNAQRAAGELLKEHIVTVG